MLADHPTQGFEERKATLESVANAGKAWKRACFAAMAVSGFLGLIILVLVMQPRWKLWVVELNNATGEVRVIGPTPETFTIHELAIKHFISRFIDDIRSIPEEKEVIKKNWRTAKHQVTPEGANILAQNEAAWKPLEQREPVVVHVLRVSARDANRFDAWWEERTYSIRHELVKVTPYRGLFTVQWRTPRTEDERQDAPLGLFFHLWTIEQGQ